MSLEKSELSQILETAIENHKKNNFTIAEDLYKKILKIDNKHTKAIFLLGNLALQKKKFAKAEEYYLKLIEIDSSIEDAHNNLGIVYSELNFFDKAEKSFKKAIEKNQNYPDAYSNLGLMYRKLNLLDKSEINFEKAIRLNPNFFKAYENLMEMYEKTNQDNKLNALISDAEKIFTNNPIIDFYKSKIFFKNELFFDAIKILETVYFDKKQKSLEKSRMSILAKCYDNINEYDKAFDCFQKSNNLSAELINHEVDKNSYLQDIITREKFFKNVSFKNLYSINIKNSEPEPIFLIGFPRSGTTLLDTILRSHKEIEVLEEKPILSNTLDYLNELKGKNLDALSIINENEILNIRGKYYEILKSNVKKYDKSKIFIDKLPLNIIHVGEILKIFPNAKFIVSIRHPCDCVLSCFMQDFKLNNAMSNFLNLKDSAKLYDLVMDLWFLFKSKLSINYHEIKYENLILNFGDEIKSVLDFLEVSWDDNIYNYQQTARKTDQIFTPSYNQVIKPLYSKASGRWINYKNHISEIFPVLKPWIKKLNYE